MLTVNELFSGIGAFRKALIRLNIPHEVIGISEIDDFAIKSYEAIYGATRNYGDISKVERLDYADLWTYGFPCQDISIIGRMKGIKKGETRSGLVHEVGRLLITAKDEGKLPKYLILENVKNLVGKFSTQFNEWLGILDEIGFNSHCKVMNAKDYGIPQNRERVFAVSIRKDIDNGFHFPDAVPLRFTFAEALENDVPEKYYLSPKYVQFLREHSLEMRKHGNGFVFEPFDRERERERERERVARSITGKAGQRITDNFILEHPH